MTATGELAGLIFTDRFGQRDFITRVIEMTTDEDRKFKDRRYEGYCPRLKRKVRVFLRDPNYV